MINCRVCEKYIIFRAYSLDGIRKDVCRKCCNDIRKIEPDRTMPTEERIKILLEKRKNEQTKRLYKRGTNPNSRNGFKKGHGVRNTGRTQFKKGLVSIKKDKNYEQIYGIEKAGKIKENLRLSHLGQISAMKGTKGILKPNKTSYKKGVYQGFGFKKGNKSNFGSKRSEESKKRMSLSKIGSTASEETKKKMSIASKRNWSNEEFREKQLKKIMEASQRRPTKLEQKFIDFFKKKNVPFEYNYCGRIQIGYKIPDFTDSTKKLVVEVGNKIEKSLPRKGRGYHNWQEYEQQRIKHFARYNYECVCFWEDELDNPKEILNKISSLQ